MTLQSLSQSPLNPRQNLLDQLIYEAKLAGYIKNLNSNQRTSQTPLPAPITHNIPLSAYSNRVRKRIKRYRRQIGSSYIPRKYRQAQNYPHSYYRPRYVTIHAAPQPEYGIAFRTRQWIDCKFTKDKCKELEDANMVVECNISRFR